MQREEMADRSGELTRGVSNGDAIFSPCLNFNVVVTDCIIAVGCAARIFQGTKKLIAPVLSK